MPNQEELDRAQALMDKAEDPVAAAIAFQGAEKGQEGMKNPAEMIAAEEALPPEEETPGTTETPPSDDQTVEVTQEQLDALVIKVKQPEVELSESEKLILDKMDKDLVVIKSTEPEPEYKINGAIVKESELEARWRKEKGLGDLDISKDAKRKLLTDFAEVLNKQTANRNITQGFQRNAEERKALEAESRRLREERIRFEAEQRAKQQEHQQNAAKIKSRDELIKNSGLTPEQIEHPETIQNDPKALRAYYKYLDAVEELPGLREAQKQIEKDIASQSDKVLKLQIDELIANHPQYKTKEPIDTLIGKILSKQPITDPNDKLIALELIDFVDQASNRGVEIEDIYALHEQRGTLAIKASAQSGPSPASPELPSARQNLLDRIKKFQQKANLSPSSAPAGGGGGERGSAGRERLATAIHRRDREILGESDSHDPLLKELGYGTKIKA